MKLALFPLVAAGLAVCVCTATPAAFAQSSDPAAADALFQKGREAAEKGDWAGACPKFAESQRLDPAPGTLLNLADCEEHLGQLASAYEHFKTALETMAPSDDRIPFARQHMAAVEKKVPHLTLNAAPDLPPGAKVMRDDVQLGSASFGLAIPVNPGTHTILVSAAGHADRKVTITVKAGDALAIALRAGEAEASATPIVAAPGSASPSLPTPDAAPSAGGGGDLKRPLGIAVGAVGLAGIAAGAVTGILVLGKKSIVNDPNHCDPVTHACDQTGLDAASDGRTLSTVSTVAFAAGGAAVVAGLILFLTGGSSRAGGSSSAMTVVAPSAYAGGAGLSVLHTF